MTARDTQCQGLRRVPGEARTWSRREAVAAAACLGVAPWCTDPTHAAEPSPSFYATFDQARLTDQDGRAFRPSDLVGRLALVNFIFTGCSTACPVQTAALVGLQRQLPAALHGRVHLLSISLDPLSDTPKTLKAFARRMGADVSSWTFVTGRPQDIARVSEALRLFRPGPQVRRPDDHSTAVWLVDGTGRLRMRYAGNPPDVPRLLRELSTLNQMARPAPTR